MDTNKSTDKQNTLLLFQVILTGVLILILICGAVFLAKEMRDMRGILNQTTEKISGLDSEKVTDAVVALTKAADKLSEVDIETLNDTIASLNEASQALADVDVKELNQAVTSLKSAADTLAEFDVESLNTIVGQIASVTTGLQNATDALKKALIFWE